MPIISAPAENPAQPKGRHGQSILQGCALKFGFAFLLATRQFANYVCIALAGSVGFLVLFVNKENSTLQFKARKQIRD